MASIQEMKDYLRERGYLVGERDPKRNPQYVGSQMVATHETDGNSSFCIVGDDLDELLSEAYEREVELSTEDYRATHCVDCDRPTDAERIEALLRYLI